MKALSLTQPWATLVALGEKHIETRSWSTKYRGPLAIHAAKGFPRACKDQVYFDPFAKALSRHGGLGRVGDLPLGAVIATARLVGCIEAELASVGMVNGHLACHVGPGIYVTGPIGEFERDFGDYSIGRWAWLLEDIEPLPAPVPARGALGLWEWDS